LKISDFDLPHQTCPCGPVSKTLGRHVQ